VLRHDVVSPLTPYRIVPNDINGVVQRYPKEFPHNVDSF